MCWEPVDGKEGRTKARVLVVDDLAVNRLIVKHMCAKLGFEVLEAANGLECLHAFVSHPREVCVVLMDLKMPLMTGWEAAFHLRALENLQQVHTGPCSQGHAPDPGMGPGTAAAAAAAAAEVGHQAALQCVPGEAATGRARAAACGPMRIPIIACTSTHPEEEMSWFIGRDGAPHMQPYASCAPSPDVTPPLLQQPQSLTAPPTPLASSPSSHKNARFTRNRPGNNGRHQPVDMSCAYACEADVPTLPHSMLSAARADLRRGDTQDMHFLDEGMEMDNSDGFLLDDGPLPAVAGLPAAGTGLPAGLLPPGGRAVTPPPPPPTTNGDGVDMDEEGVEHGVVLHGTSPGEVPSNVAQHGSVHPSHGHTLCDASMEDAGPGRPGGDAMWCTTTVGQAAHFAGIDKVLVKPLRMAELQHTLDTWLPHWRSLVGRPPTPSAAATTGTPTSTADSRGASWLPSSQGLPASPAASGPVAAAMGLPV